MSILSTYIQKYANTMMDNKQMYSGIAILFVLLYHQPTIGLFWDCLFYPGFIGCDIFLFLVVMDYVTPCLTGQYMIFTNVVSKGYISAIC